MHYIHRRPLHVHVRPTAPTWNQVEVWQVLDAP